jgi:hypothetical protein
VDGAGKTMDDIVSQVNGVSDLIGEISSATTGQSRGITQVSQAGLVLPAMRASLMPTNLLRLQRGRLLCGNELSALNSRLGSS